MAVDIEKVMAYIRENAKAYAEAKSERVYLEQYRKVKKATLMGEAAGLGLKTGQERETYAYAHADYHTVLTGLQVAVEREEYLAMMIKGCWAKIDLYRTECANNRNEQKGYSA